MERSGQTLNRTQHLAYETEQIGIDTTAELGVQREQLERTRERLHETNAELSISRRIIQRLRCGVMQSRLLLIGIIIVEVLILVAVIVLKVIYRW